MAHPLLRFRDGYEGTSPELGDEIKRLQTLLRKSGFATEVDGLFGPGTERAVKDFQRAHDLDDDGIVGPRTWAALEGTPPPDQAEVDFTTTFPPNAAGLTAELSRAKAYRKAAQVAATKYGVPLAMIAGVASRESGWGLLLKPKGPGGTGDFGRRAPKPPLRDGSLPPDGLGFGRGILQIDFDSHAFARTGAWKDPAANLLYGAGLLSQNRQLLAQRTSLEGIQLWRATLAAYNCGAGNVMKAIAKQLDVDFFTSGRDYGRDTLNRTGWYRLKGWV